MRTETSVLGLLLLFRALLALIVSGSSRSLTRFLAANIIDAVEGLVSSVRFIIVDFIWLCLSGDERRRDR